MKKFFMAILLCLWLGLFLFLFTALIGEEQGAQDRTGEANQLIFNSTELAGRLMVTHPPDDGDGFSFRLSDAQLDAVFPNFGVDISATALYQGGELLHISASLLHGSSPVQIWIGEGWLAIDGSYDFNERGLQRSNIHGVEVMAAIFDRYGQHEHRLVFQTNFRMDDIRYRVQFFKPLDEEHVGKEIMADVVERLVLGGPADLSGFLGSSATEDDQGNAEEEGRLIFNSVMARRDTLSFAHPPFVTLSLSDAQLDAVVPDFEWEIYATASYFQGELRGISAAIFYDDMFRDRTINISLGKDQILADFEYTFYPVPLRSSNIYDVEVMAIIINEVSRLIFQADFSLDDIFYRIIFYKPPDREDIGREIMADVVERLVLGGPADLSGLLEMPAVE
jgi:hypothetical protein